MAHHSRVSALMIDCPAGQFEDALAFWSAALGLEPVDVSADGRYVELGEIRGPVIIRLQRVAGHGGFHIDIETDDIRAEKARLEAAGCLPKYAVKRWWVMQDPAGNAFCLVRPESAAFPRNARRWQK